MESQERPWSAAEQAYARDLIDSGSSLDAVAKALKRPPRSVAVLFRRELIAAQQSAARRN